MRLSLLESDLRAQIEEELRAEQSAALKRASAWPEGNVTQPLSTPPVSRRTWLTDDDGLARSGERPSFARSGEQPSLARSGEQPSFTRSGELPALARSGERLSLRPSAPPDSSPSLPPRFETMRPSHVSGYPRVRAEADDSIAMGSLALTTYPPPELAPRKSSRFVIFAATVAMLASVSALFVSAAQHADVTKAHASAAGAPTPETHLASGASCSGDAKLTEQDAKVVEVTPAPTLPPPSYRRSSSSSSRASANAKAADPVQDVVNGQASAAAPSAQPAPSAPAPSAAAPAGSLDQAARTAKMLRDQLGSSVH